MSASPECTKPTRGTYGGHDPHAHTPRSRKALTMQAAWARRKVEMVDGYPYYPRAPF